MDPIVQSALSDARGHLHGSRSPDLFSRLIRECKSREPIPVAVCWPCSEVSLAGAIEAAEAGLIRPKLVGPSREIRAIATGLGLSLAAYEIEDVSSEQEAAIRCTELCRSGAALALMKGSLHTDLLMKHVLQKEGGLRTARRISHVFILEAPLYDRALLITDAAINIYPNLEDKIDIVQNAIDLAHVLGVPEPRVAIMSAIETVNPKIISTLDAAALCKMSDRGQITGARLAGIVVGAKVPIILTSRADLPESRVASCAVACMVVHASLNLIVRTGNAGSQHRRYVVKATDRISPLVTRVRADLPRLVVRCPSERRKIITG